LRWKAPQPAAKWQGLLQAAEFSNACWQTPYPAAAAIYQAKLPPLSEDCLYLNIWTPAKSSKDRLPVMVWIHGGGFTRGYGGSRAYDGEALARKGAVIVTINYRLGVFGFFAHPALSAESGHHASGNYALLDQIAPLQWVQKNIAAFGGDPTRVTIFGESAGSWAVNVLMASPLARGFVFSHEAAGGSRKRRREAGGFPGSSAGDRGQAITAINFEEAARQTGGRAVEEFRERNGACNRGWLGLARYGRCHFCSRQAE
jgi:para-nitrobenzyl esterase